MAGRGPAPKDPSRRARTNKDPVPLRVIAAEPVPQPELPDFEIEVDDELVEFVWPQRTREWWRMWAESPLSAEFTSTDWSELLDTAVLHARFWRGDHKIAAELRLRVAKFGATPEDRARLRITFAQADEAEDKAPRRESSASSRYAGLRLAD
ncbi:hypothetical protein ABZ863_01720 [Saccharomonospora sp. NPDC046836]|uniref:phage terminase small subunit n=1 Tax=Saccharomonospora sp. NPDC046836 TaxID=3156921 RepID=UPI0034054D87